MKSKLLILLSFLVAGCNQLEKKKVAAEYNEAALKEFVLASHDNNKTKSLQILDSVLTNAAQDSAVFTKTTHFLEKPFCDPNSTYRNEGLYAGILQSKMKSEWTDSSNKAATREKLYLLMQNRAGSIANNFLYTTATGLKRRMSDLEAQYTLLYFYNPGCNACKEMKTALRNSAIVNSKVSNKELKVLAIYTDKEESVWLSHLSEMPEEWINGRDEDEYLFRNKVYDLRAIPTLYLLDKNKNVILKDCINIKDIETELNNVANK